MPKKQFRTLSVRVPEFVHQKVDFLLTELRPLGEPRALKEDLVGALIEVATAAAAARALHAYNPKLGRSMAELERRDG